MSLVAWVWIGIAVLATVIELHAQTVYLMAVAAGLFVGGLLGLGGARLEIQLIAVAGVLAAGYPLAHGYRAGQSRLALASADVGQEVEVIAAPRASSRRPSTAPAATRRPSSWWPRPPPTPSR